MLSAHTSERAQEQGEGNEAARGVDEEDRGERRGVADVDEEASDHSADPDAEVDERS